MTNIIYRITNTQNGKMYIGQTTKSLEVRWGEHLKYYKDYKYHFYRAIKKYGTDCWLPEVIKIVDDISLLNEREKFWISYYNSNKTGYNMTVGVDGVKGYKPTKEAIDKHRESRKGYRHSEETKQKIREKLSGKIRSKEHSENISKAKKGKPSTSSTKFKKGNTAWNVKAYHLFPP